jgi:EAL domain-containing protein (putative c-di-GMP-specific phosphodiesterase class I)
MLKTISTPITVQDSEVMVSGSIGITMIPKDGTESTELLVNADTAMYTAKNEGKHAVAFFTVEMKEKRFQSIRMGKNLHKAIERGEFFLEYQPQYDAKTGKIFGAEALLRWHTPQRGVIPPHEFIPIAEKNGMIIPIGEWVLREVISFQKNLKALSHKDIRISVNISGRQLRDDQFMNFLASLLRDSGVNPRLLELEITESSIFENIQENILILKRVKSLGVRLAIDDFGIGHSSLNYLQKLPFDTVKIDNSFINKISNIDTEFPILRGIISISTDMGLDVIAEGVETETQLNYLNSHDCNFIQGHYFNPSFSEQKLLQILSAQGNYVIQPSGAINLAYSG